MSTTRTASSNDRFGVTLLFSLIAHAVVILGITFTYAAPASRLPSLDVILIQSTNKEKADKADFLAQANNAGGGDRDEARRPADPLSSPLPKPTAQELIEKNAEMAQLAQEYQRQKDSYAKRPKKKFLSANTKEYAYASYLAGWAARIERIGNLNYPDEARRQKLHGDVLLTVTLNKDGSVKRMDVIQSSGHKVLDDAVQRIVQLAAPFPPIPKTAEDIDELYITRTWQFLPGDVLRNR